MKNRIIIANWKLNKTIEETSQFFDEFLPLVEKSKQNIIICPAYLSLYTAVTKTLNSKVSIGAQNMHHTPKGVITGEVSPLQLLEIGVKHSIIGHSSRRTELNETNEDINKKIISAIEHKISPILCVGETRKEKEAGRTYRVLKKQLITAFDGVETADGIIVAYEPLWAISDGKTPAKTPETEEVSKTISGIKRVVKQIFGAEEAKKIKYLYGGSVTPNDAKGFMSIKSVSGVLVGGASLSPQKFADIVKSVE